MANPYAPPTETVGTGTGWAGTSDDYEFDITEEQIIAKAGRRARLWGIISIVIGALYLVGAAALLIGSSMLVSMLGPRLGMAGGAIIGGAMIVVLLGGVVFVIVGKLYIDAGAALERVVTSSGRDIEHAMDALRGLGTAFQVEALMTAAVMVVGLVLGLLGASSDMGAIQ